MISVLILTLNEELNLPACLESVRWSDDIVVLDSGSTDRTVEIAKAAGARVVHRPFDDERSHRTASLSLGFRHPWVYNPDADEVTPLELAEEMKAVVSDRGRAEVAYRVRFKNMFRGRWLRRSGLYPTWVVRLFRPERVRFARTINLQYVIDGPEGRLNSHFLHYSFNKGMDHWREKHRRYAALEAEDNLRELRECPVDVPGLFDIGAPVRRRRALKLLSMRLPFRPWLRFLYMYVLRMGFLDGGPGLEYCRLMKWYEGEIVRNMRLLRENR